MLSYELKVYDLVQAAKAVGVVNADEALCSFVWQNKFCNGASAEWLVDPLTELQIYHVTYHLDLLDAFVQKIGVNSIPLAKGC